MYVQSVSFPSSEWTSNSSKHWLLKHNYLPIKPAHNTNNFIKYRLVTPNKFYNYSTIILPNGVHLTLIK